MTDMDLSALKWYPIHKLKYQVSGGIQRAEAELNYRLSDRTVLPLPGLHGERLYLTGYRALQKRAEELNRMYDKLPARRGVRDLILLDAWSSATIEGARTTVEQVRKSFDDPRTKDDRMVINGVIGCNYAYKQPITDKNIRKLWDKIVMGVCENEGCRGTKYRNAMVYVGKAHEVIHTPAAPEQLPGLMEKWFAYRDSEAREPLLQSFAAHFYFVYIHPFCDGNGRTARILNASHLYHRGYGKMKSLPLGSAINQQLSGYYRSLEDSERVMRDGEEHWMDLSPFVVYMLDAFERCLMDAALARNLLSEGERTLLTRMNKTGSHGEITIKKAAGILRRSDSTARAVLTALVEKGYLDVDTSKTPYIYCLRRPSAEL